MAKKIRTYSTAFKAEAVKKIADNNGTWYCDANLIELAEQSQSRQAFRN